jgi:hypothetical protein
MLDCTTDTPKSYRLSVKNLVSEYKTQYAALGINSKTWTHIEQLAVSFRAILPQVLTEPNLLRPWEFAGIQPFNVKTMLEQVKGISPTIVEDSLARFPQLLEAPTTFRLTDEVMDKTGMYKTEIQTVRDGKSNITKRDDKVLQMQRNLILTHSSFLDFQEQQYKKREQENKQAEEKKREKEERKIRLQELEDERERDRTAIGKRIADAVRAKQSAKAEEELQLARQGLPCTPEDLNKISETVQPHTQGHNTDSDDARCPLCFVWWSHWCEVETNLSAEVKWSQCASCEQWFCPRCLSFSQVARHETGCLQEVAVKRAAESAAAVGASAASKRKNRK